MKGRLFWQTMLLLLSALPHCGSPTGTGKFGTYGSARVEGRVTGLQGQPVRYARVVLWCRDNVACSTPVTPVDYDGYYALTFIVFSPPPESFHVTVVASYHQIPSEPIIADSTRVRMAIEDLGSSAPTTVNLQLPIE